MKHHKILKRAAVLALAASLMVPGNTALAAGKWKGTGSRKYYVDQKGKKVTGLTKIGKKYYYLKSGKPVKKVWKTVKGKKYYFRSNGAAAKGLLKIGKNYYYFDVRGRMVKSQWKTIKGKKYYFRSKGTAAVGTLKIKGKKYRFNSKGVLLTKPDQPETLPTEKPVKPDQPETPPTETEKPVKPDQPETPPTEKPVKPDQPETPPNGYTYQSNGGFTNAYFYGKETLAGGEESSFGVRTCNPGEPLDPNITFEISNDCADIYELYEQEGNGYRSINALVYGRKPGTCTITARSGSKIIDTAIIEVTSKDTDFFEYEAWKADIKAKYWKPGMNEVEKLRVFGDYVLEHYDYNANCGTRYGWSKGIGGDCMASTYMFLDIALDLGLKGEAYWPLCFQENSFHHVAKIWINGRAYLFDAGYSGKAPRGFCLARPADEMTGW